MKPLMNDALGNRRSIQLSYGTERTPEQIQAEIALLPHTLITPESDCFSTVGGVAPKLNAVAVLAALVRQWCERFDAKIVTTSTGCHRWMGAKQTNGYGSFGCGGTKSMLAHRFAYERYIGPIRPGLVTDHLCRNRLCVNPAHLEVVTTAENNRRGMAPTAVAHRLGVCAKGHQLSQRADGRQRCRECGAAYNRDLRAKAAALRTEAAR